MKTRTKRAGVLLASLSLITAVTACGRDDDGSEAAPGVTDEPCPNAVDEDKGCIYLGVITDLTGIFKGVGDPLTAGQKSFWADVNKNGGIGDYEVDVTKYVEDNGYDTTKHAEAYGTMKDDVLALAQSLGTAHTNGILGEAKDDSMLILPVSLASVWMFEEGVVEVGTNYCAEGMNIVDHAVDEFGAKSIASIHFPGDYGDDAAVGVEIAAEERGVELTDIPIAPGQEAEVTAAIGQVVRAKPDVVVVTTSPTELAQIVGGAAAQGFQGKFIGSIPTWNSALLGTPAKGALEAMYLQATSFGTWEADTPGHEAMRAAAGDQAPNDWYMIGWAGGYAMKAALEQAIENDDLTREGLYEAASELEGVDSQGTLPEGSGNYAGDPNERVVRATAFNSVGGSAASGTATATPASVGPTAAGYDFAEPCYLQK